MLKSKLNMAVLFIVVLFIVSVTNITAFANELPDLRIKGTIIISMEKDGKAVSGGEFEIYHIADLSVSDGKSKYVFTKDYKNCGLSLDNIESEKFASEMESYIKSNKLNGIKKNVGDNGIAEFSQLELGTYFVIQNESAKGYSKATSFKVSLPVLENGKYSYTVYANPKFTSTDLTDNTQPATTQAAEHTKPADTRLPKTGQLNLPIPILTVLGICMLASGLIICFSGRKEKNEE